MLRLYESKQRMNDAIYCLEKAMENSQHVNTLIIHVFLKFFKNKFK